MTGTQQPYTLDRVVRLVISSVVIIGILLLISRLSDVLIPFFVAVFIVYLIDPFVRFLQAKLRLKKRFYAVLVALLCVVLAVFLFVEFAVPTFVNEMIRMGNLVSVYLEKVDYTDVFPGDLELYLKDFFEHYNIKDYLNPDNIAPLVHKALSQIWTVVEGSYQLFSILAGGVIVMLYVVFLLIDFENLQTKWPGMVPAKYRNLCVEVVNDLQQGMHTYFRMQGLICLIIGVLFSLGFWMIDLPLAVMMGLLLGLLNFVPYLYLVGLIPAMMLAMLGALDSGRTFWHEGLLVLLVVGSVQMFQDLYLMPKIMGKAYGLNPAVMLLSLSIWGSLLGFIGLLLALPLTTILVSYYKRFILRYEFDYNVSQIILPPTTDLREDPPQQATGE